MNRKHAVVRTSTGGVAKMDADEVQAAAEERAARGGGDQGEHQKASLHAHFATNHALHMNTPEAHELARQAHQKVADMHAAKNGGGPS